MRGINKIHIANEEALFAFGMELAKKLKPGDVIALEGDLGVGKTSLTKAIAKGLGIKDYITSPTFTIIHEYLEGRLPLYHFDVYRLDEEYEFHELGYEEYFYGEGVSLVEWADKIREFLPKDRIYIRLEYGPSEGERYMFIEEGESNEAGKSQEGKR